MERKAKLTIILKADETTVIEAENPILWQKVLLALHTGSSEVKLSKHEEVVEEPIDSKIKNGNPLNNLAAKIGVTIDVLKGAIDPSFDPPYIYFDRHCWEAMKKQTPSRGRGAISPTAIAATLLCLWFNEAGMSSPTQAQALEALRKIGIVDKNPSRGIKATPWLQSRSNGIVINPAQISKANSIAESFCAKNWSAKETSE